MIFDHSLDMILTIVVLSFWFLFPIGMFVAAAQLDKNSDQILRMEGFKEPVPEKKIIGKTAVKKRTAAASTNRRPRLLPH